MISKYNRYWNLTGTGLRTWHEKWNNGKNCFIMTEIYK